MFNVQFTGVLAMNGFSTQVYRFGRGVVDGNGSMRELLGGKGAGLAEMTLLSIPVPPGFTVTTDVCRAYLKEGRVPPGLQAEQNRALEWLEAQCGKRFGDPGDPLLVSVRSGAPISMPGMMDTVLNVGLNDDSVRGLAAKSGSEIFALDSYRRLLHMFGTVVLEVPEAEFQQAMRLLHGERQGEHVGGDGTNGTVSAEQLRGTICAYKDAIARHCGRPFPNDPQEQLAMAVEAVFRSWNSDRARFYRKLNKIDDAMGTAVTVQAMAFGNRGPDSGTGVGFTRDPSSGAKEMFAEYLADAQGEDIVAGVRTPMPISELAGQMPDVYKELVELTGTLERHHKDAQDFEFTVDSGKLFLLQTRSAKRAAPAAVKIAVDMANEGLITRAEALRRVKVSDVIDVLSPKLDIPADAVPLTTGLPASPGAAVGVIALSAEDAVRMHEAGEEVVLIREETSAEDIQGMDASVGFLTARGGATSHAAVVARGMGKCCITGAKNISIDESAHTAQIGATALKEGDWISLDGSTGRVFAGRLPMRPATQDHPELKELLSWARETGACKVRANADTPADATAAVACGAVGIGLCRTEHMFFAPDRLEQVRAMILAKTADERVKALEQLLPIQQGDFEALFRTMAPLPVTVRLLDPPLHEFLPSARDIEQDITDARTDEDWDKYNSLAVLKKRVEALTEANPMMGHRGCRLSLTYPEILQMQVRAIMQAAVTVAKEGLDTCPEIMVPLVSSEEEMRALAKLIHSAAHEVTAEGTQHVEYKIGTMIELPRAAVCAGPISRHVSFISFGTNDLTQMTYGFSRDDARSYLDHYLEHGIFKADPFTTIDQEGVGHLIGMAITSVREVNPSIKIGICGEHGGDPDSIRFFHSLGVDYVSCSPARLPVAQLAVAHASASA